MSTDVATVELSNSAAASEPDPQPHQLSQFLPGEAYGDNPVVRLSGDGRDLVVVGRKDATTVEVYRDRQLSTCPAHLTATAVADPLRRTDLLRQALATSTQQRTSISTELQAAKVDLQTSNTDLQTARADLRDARQDRNRALDEVRRYAISAYQDDEISLGSLNNFLEQLNLDRYEPTVRVRFTISGSVDVDGTEDLSSVERDVKYSLDLDASQVDDVVEDSIVYETTITEVEQVE